MFFSCFKRIQNPKGATYLMVLMIVMVMGIMLGITGQSWKQVMSREREEELLFRGLQIRDALESWHNPKPLPGQIQPSPLNDINHLLKDPRTAGNTKYLRRLYKDPITNSEWKLIKDPVHGIIGVTSASDLKPIKQGNFPADMAAFAGKNKYSEWQFVCVPKSTQASLPEAGRRTPEPPAQKTPGR